MKKVFAIILALALFTALISASAFAAESKGTLNLYTWAEMFDPDVLAHFERESGYQINYVNFDLNETMLAKLEAAKGGDYDLIIADDYIIEKVISEDLKPGYSTYKAFGTGSGGGNGRARDGGLRPYPPGA